MDSLEARSEIQSIYTSSYMSSPGGSDSDWRAAYSMSAPEMRRALTSASAELNGPKSLPEAQPESLPESRPESLPAAPQSKTPDIDAPAAARAAPDTVPGPLPEEQASQDDKSHVVDPCKKIVVAPNLTPGIDAKPMERVQDRDPELYKEIKGKVKDPRYIGQNGDITVSTHDKKGHINGCTFVQNTPYWLDYNAAKSYLDVNKALAPKHKEITVDHLNGAGRTLGQEEGIAWRNTGLHAKPGKSNHGFGRAIDIQDQDGAKSQPSDDKEVREALHANGFRQGDSHGPLKNDLHHWSYTGPGRASEGHPIAPRHSSHGHGHGHGHGHWHKTL